MRREVTSGMECGQRRRRAGRRRCRPPSGSGTTPGDRRRNSTGPESSCWRSRCFRRCSPRSPSAKEGEQKTILQVYVSSISAHEFLLGKILTFMVVAFCECLLLLTLLFTYFGLNFAGDPTPFHRGHHSLRVLRGCVRHPDRRGDSQSGGRHAGGGAGRLSAGLHALRSDLSASRTFRFRSAGSRTSSGAATTSTSCATRCCKAAAGPRCGGRC